MPAGSLVSTAAAMKQVYAYETLAQYLALAERVLVDAAATEAFEGQLSDADDVEEVVFWLKRRAGQ